MERSFLEVCMFGLCHLAEVSIMRMRMWGKHAHGESLVIGMVVADLMKSGCNPRGRIEQVDYPEHVSHLNNTTSYRLRFIVRPTNASVQVNELGLD